MSEAKTLPPGCGYSGHEFGASYPDSQCFGGVLYDMDNCDDRGRIYEPRYHVPCPSCNHVEWLETHKEEIEMMGWTAFESGTEESRCPFPEAAKLYPQDGQKLKEWWIAGWREANKDSDRAVTAPASD